MSWWQGLFLGLVQGLTEFLPVSSSGHLVVAQELVGYQSPGVVVEVLLHVATLLAVVIVYRRKLSQVLVGMLRRDRNSLRYALLIVVATIPAVVVGLTMKDLIERSFDSLYIVGVDFIATGTILWSTTRIGPSERSKPEGRSALLVGVAQALAILPGISRSGTTISAGLWLKWDPVEAAEFSFVMAIPAIAGAAVLQLPELNSASVTTGIAPLAIAFVAALVSGITAISLLVALIKRRAFHKFAGYCWLLGVGVLAWSIFR